MKQIFALPTSTAVLFATLLTQQAAAATLQEAVATAIENNPEILTDAHERLALDQSVNQARAGYLPTVDIAAGYGYTDSNNNVTRGGSFGNTDGNAVQLMREEAGAKVKQMLFDGFAVKNQVDQAQALADAAAYKLANTSERIGLTAVTAYFDILRYKALTELAADNLKIHQDIFQRIQQRANQGVGKRADTDLAEARVALATTNFKSAEGNFRNAETAYQRVMGNLPQNPVEPDKLCCTLMPTTLKEALETAFAKHPKLRSAAAKYDAALSQQLAAYAPMMPQVNLELEANQNYNVNGVKGVNQDALAMLRVKQNVFHGGKDLARIEQTKQLSEQEKQLAENSRREVEESIRLSWNALDIVSLKLPAMKKHADSAKRSYDAYEQQFSIGQRTLLDLLDVQTEYFKSQSEYINGQYDERYSSYRLLASMGQLIPSLGIAPRPESLIE